MGKTKAGGARWAACVLLALLLALCGFSAVYAEEAFADQVPGSAAETTAIVDDAPCVSGQAIACVTLGHEVQLAQLADSVEYLLALDAQTSGCGPCSLVLVKSSSLSVEDLIAALEACEGVVFVEPN